MFAKALKSASIYTQPLIMSQRFYDGEVNTGCATFIILNEEGWILTSFHIIAPILEAQKHAAEIKAYEKKKNEIESNPSYKKKKRKKMISELTFNNKWITNFSYWWGKDGIKVKRFEINPISDLATGKLEPFNNEEIAEYPVFKNPEDKLQIGTSLCKLGFPFHTIKSTFNEDTGGFELEPKSLPMPRFPLDGIYTRDAIGADKKSNKQAKFLETSTPGLRGQSGGPIFDVNGHICGLQSRTKHYDLGFKPKIKRDKKEIEENQFLNVGLGTHVEEIIKFLTEHDIAFSLSAAN